MTQDSNIDSGCHELRSNGHRNRESIQRKNMQKLSRIINLSIANAYTTDFAYARLLIDIGGGDGSFLQTVLDEETHLQGILFERPVMIERVRHTSLARHPRISLKQGDFLSSLPTGGDIYIFKSIIMNCSDDESIRILQNCCNAMQPDGNVLVIEQVLYPEIDQDTFGRFINPQIPLTLLRGNRTEREYRQLFRRAGLFVTRVIPTSSGYSIVEGKKA